MLKIQITAKAIWNGLFLYFIGYILSFFVFIPQQKAIHTVPTNTILVGALLCLGLLIYRLRSISLPLRLTGMATIVAEQNWQIYFIQINRLACILVGLILLGGSLELWGWATTLIVHLFPALRDWLTLWIENPFSEALGQTAFAIAYLFYPFGFLLFCVYLVSGADAFIRRQVKLFEQYLIRESKYE